MPSSSLFSPRVTHDNSHRIRTLNHQQQYRNFAFLYFLFWVFLFAGRLIRMTPFLHVVVGARHR
jgi:hypothetical protein